MQRPMKKILLTSSLVLLVFILLIAFAYLLPVPIPPYLDFQVLYHANLGLLQGIPLYDHAGQAEMIAGLAGVAPDQVFVLPFPYPPWYALATIFLALPPIEVAARLWFGMNLIMLAGSIWLVTNRVKGSQDRPDKPRMQAGIAIIKYLLAILFIPVLGSLYVGQYIFPVLLGAALMIFALHRENAGLTALAAALLTFKPHLGGPLLLAVLIHLLIQRTAFTRRALTATLATGLFLFAIGFLADPNWPVNYIHSLVNFREVPGVDTCGLCASLPITLGALISGQTDLGLALPVGGMLFLLLTGGLILLRRDIFRSPEAFIPAAILVTLLADPYLLNYDFALLLVPLFITVLQTPARELDMAVNYISPAIDPVRCLRSRRKSLSLPCSNYSVWGLDRLRIEKAWMTDQVITRGWLPGLQRCVQPVAHSRIRGQ